MDTKNIQSLIQKYFDCSTSIEQERELGEYFSGENIDPSLMNYKGLFSPCYSDQELGDDFDTKILSKINRKPKLRTMIYAWSSVAACIAIMLGLGLRVHTLNERERMAFYQKDTFTDPYEALAQVEATLEFVASKVGESRSTLREGAQATQPVFDFFKVEDNQEQTKQSDI